MTTKGMGDSPRIRVPTKPWLSQIGLTNSLIIKGRKTDSPIRHLSINHRFPRGSLTVSP